MIKGSVLYFTDEVQSSVASNVCDVLSSGRLVRDVQAGKFEESLKTKFGFPDIALVNSNTSAFDLLFGEECLSVSGKAVAFLGNCFPSPIFSAVRAGAIVKFLDIDPRTLEVRLDNPNLDYLVVTSVGGMVPPNVDKILKFCSKNSIILIEDAAHSVGASRDSYRTGLWADFSVFSFSATKRLTCGEGGGVVCDDPEMLDMVRCLARYGKATDFGDADCVSAGHSLRFNEIDAAIGRAMLDGFDDSTLLRKSVADIYISRLSSSSAITLYDYGESNWYKFPIFIKSKNLFNYVSFADDLKNAGVQLSARVYEIPAYRQRPLRKLTEGASLLGTDLFCSNHICLPMWDGLSTQDAECVCDSLLSVLEGVH